MTVTLITFGMLFGTLFLGYFLARFNAPTWPPVEIENMLIAARQHQQRAAGADQNALDTVKLDA